MIRQDAAGRLPHNYEMHSEKQTKNKPAPDLSIFTSFPFSPLSLSNAIDLAQKVAAIIGAQQHDAAHFDAVNFVSCEDDCVSFGSRFAIRPPTGTECAVQQIQADLVRAGFAVAEYPAHFSAEKVFGESQNRISLFLTWPSSFFVPLELGIDIRLCVEPGARDRFSNDALRKFGIRNHLLFVSEDFWQPR